MGNETEITKPKQLFQVDIELTIMVMARDEQEASSIAKPNIKHETHWADCVAREPNMANFPNDWIRSNPYGSDDDKTCKEILGILR